jgi:hypothetical protein
LKGTTDAVTSATQRQTVEIAVGGIRSARWSWPSDDSATEASLTHVRDVEHFYSCFVTQHKATGTTLQSPLHYVTIFLIHLHIQIDTCMHFDLRTTSHYIHSYHGGSFP